ncbi:hypothetical protein I4U23_004446 [Adineta vaga]|uniref:AIG1-like protein n=1 Tax=Adineta vaga TaxID=104782 RepID=B3G4J1_ADIVA|nr:AIG1-like protein [Adineta vaga]UJR17550.1 hypothetical protein I4U23_004446 [Adineta vaga]
MDQYHSLSDILAELKQQRDEKPQQYITVPTDQERTLLLVGPIRTGKSIIAETVENSLYQPERPITYSATRTAQIRQIGSLRIIDIPGFNEFQVGQFRLSNDSILQMIEEQISEHNSIDLFAFVFHLNYGIKEEDIKLMIYIKSKLPDLAERIILIITHAEEFTDQEKNRLSNEFFNHPKVKKNRLESFFQKKIFFLGCLRYESLNQRDKEALVRQHENVLKMRKQFIEKCFEDLPPVKQPKQKSYIYKSLSSRYVYVSILVFIVALAIGYASSSYINSITNQNKLVGKLTDTVNQKIVEMENMAKTIKTQKENLEAQKKRAETQSRTLEAQAKAAQEQSEKMKKLTRHLIELEEQIAQAKKKEKKSFWSSLFG